MAIESWLPARRMMWMAMIAIGMTRADATTVATLEELSFPAEQDFYNGDGGPSDTQEFEVFTSSGAGFENHFTDLGGGCCWEGFAYSRATDSTTPGPANEYSAIAGGGAGGSTNYAVGFSGLDAGFGTVAPTLYLPPSAQPISVQVTNTTYTALGIRDGTAFSDPFGGPSGDEPDFLRLTIRALDESGAAVAELAPFYLADYRFADNQEDYLVDEWMEIDLTPLRNMRTSRLELRLETSDIGDFGPNTPLYVAIDDVAFDFVRPGDFNGDLRVDAADYTLWRDTLGQSVAIAGAGADGDLSGAVDSGDYAVWKEHFGADYSVAQLSQAPVPEPRAIALVLTALFAFGCRLRLRSRL